MMGDGRRVEERRGAEKNKKYQKKYQVKYKN